IKVILANGAGNIVPGLLGQQQPANNRLFGFYGMGGKFGFGHGVLLRTRDAARAVYASWRTKKTPLGSGVFKSRENNRFYDGSPSSAPSSSSPSASTSASASTASAALSSVSVSAFSSTPPAREGMLMPISVCWATTISISQ